MVRRAGCVGLAAKSVRSLALILLCLGTGARAASAFDFAGYVATHKHQALDVFIQNFPFDEYLKTVKFTDLARIQNDRMLLWQTFGDGDIFVYHLGDRFIADYPVGSKLAEIDRKITIAEFYLRRQPGFNQGTGEIYRIIGFYILGRVAERLEQEIRSERLDADHRQVRSAIRRLEANKVFVPIEESAAMKVLTNIRQGNVRYLYNRTSGVLRDQVVVVLAALVAMLSGVLLLLFRWRFTVLKVAAVGVAMLLPVVGGIALVGVPRTADGAQAVQSPFTLHEMRSLYPATDGIDHTVRLYGIKDGGGRGEDVGQAIWLRRPDIKASYLAHGRVGNRYHAAAKAGGVVLVTTGGFTNAQSLPEGLTIDAGRLVNAMIMHDRHGLVMVSNHGINVLNLREHGFQLPRGRLIGNPLASLVDYSELLRWANQHQATLFQTQLLASGDALLIDPSRAKREERERRILALVRDLQTDELHHVIFNIRRPYPLAIAASDVFAFLKSRNKRVEALLNLDVGSFDILEVYDERGRVIQEVKGPRPVANATNLLVYSR